MASSLGQPVSPDSHPRLYRNLGAAGFRDVAPDVGLNRVVARWVPVLVTLTTMGSSISTWAPDRRLLFRPPEPVVQECRRPTVRGRHQFFGDRTPPEGTWSVVRRLRFRRRPRPLHRIRRRVPGDKAYNALFLNPGHGRHWLKVKLVGTRTNRAALGARIQVDLERPDGLTRSIYRQVGARPATAATASSS